jgi:YD repeat-containing protein
MTTIIAGAGLGLFTDEAPAAGAPAPLPGRGHQFINVVTGNLVLQHLDEQLSGRGIDLAHRRTYNAQGWNEGNSDGWHFDTEGHLTVQGALNSPGSSITRIGGDGRQRTHRWDASRGRYLSAEGAAAGQHSVRYEEPQREFVWQDGVTRREERYAGSSKRLKSETDVNGNAVLTTRDAAGLATSQVDRHGKQQLAMIYGGAAPATRLARVDVGLLATDAEGRAMPTPQAAFMQLQYGYDAQGRLDTVSQRLEQGAERMAVTGYTYEQDSCRIAAIHHADGSTTTLTYDAAGRVSSISDASGTLRLDYVPQNGYTDVSDAENRTWRYVYDAAKRLTHILAPALSEGGERPTRQWHYDSAGRLQQYDNELGQTSTFSYDGLGNCVAQTDPGGIVTTRTFDAQQQVLTLTHHAAADSGTPLSTRHAYDDRARLRFLVTPAGRVTEYRYGPDTEGLGQLRSVRRYTHALFDVASLGPQQGISLQAMQAWQAAQEARRVALTEYTYDARGNLAQRIDYARTDAQGQGILDAGASVTDFTHGPRGELRRTAAMRGNDRAQRQDVSTAAYDALGRLVQAADAAGVRSVDHNSMQRLVRTTHASGLVNTVAFDARGRLIGETNADGQEERSTLHVHDDAGRLRMVQDALGGRLFRFYDAQGRLAHEVDREGAVIGHSYDAAGRLTSTIRYANRAATANWFDGANVVRSQLVVGGAQADIEPDADNDRVTTLRYDTSGRLVEQSDAPGVSVRRTYDAMSRIVQEVRGERITRIIRDADGLPVGELDAQGHLTERRYDAAGRCTQTLRYALPSPAAVQAHVPVWEGVRDVTVQPGQTLLCALPAPWAADGGPVTTAPLQALPQGVHWHAAGLALTGNAPQLPGTYAIALRASHGDGALVRSVDVNFQLVVQRAAPAWGPLPDLTGLSLDEDFVADLPAAAPATTAWVYTMRSALPPGLAFDAGARRLHGRLQQPALHTLTVRVADPEDENVHVDCSFTLHVGNRGPVWNAGVAPQHAVRTQPYALTLGGATDPEGQQVRYRLASAPSWLQLANPSVPKLEGTPPALAAAPALHDVRVEAEDSLGEVSLLTFCIEVRNAAPLWAPALPPAPPVAHGQPMDYTPPAATDPEGGPIAYSVVSGLPAGLALDAASGRITGRSPSVGQFDVTLRATDSDGGHTDRRLRITLTNSAPVYQRGLPGIQMYQGNPVGGTVPPDAFADPEGDAMSAYRIRGAIPGFMPNGLTPGLYFHVGSGVFRYHDPNAPVGAIIPVTVEVTDAHGAVGVHTFHITVIPLPTSPTPPPPPPPDPLPGLPRSVPNAAPRAVARALPSVAPAATPATAAEPDPLAAWRPDGGEVLRRWHFHDGLGREVASVDEAGFLTETVFDEAGNRQRILRYPNPVQVNDGDTPDSLRASAGAPAQESQIVFDAFGRPSEEIAVDGLKTRRTYDNAGRLVREVQADGTDQQRGRRWRYNAFGELTGEVGGEGDAQQADTDLAIEQHGVRHAYDRLGRRTRTTDALGNSRWFYYDREGRLTHRVNSAGEVSETRYSAFGQPVQVRRMARRLDMQNAASALTGGAADDAFLRMLADLADPTRDSVEHYAYDQRGLLVRHTDADGAVTLNNYTPHGQLAEQVRSPAPGHTVVQRYAYDLCGRQVVQTEDYGACNANHRQGWDGFGRLVRSIDPAGQITAQVYLLQGRGTLVTDPLERTQRIEIDRFGRVIARTDAKGRRTTQRWDDVRHTLAVRSPLGHEVTTQFSRYGEVLGIQQSLQDSTRTYDRDGRLLTVTDARGQTTERHRYDAAGRRIESIDAHGTTTAYAYDGEGRLVAQSLDPLGLNLRTEFTHDAFGRLEITRTIEDTRVARVTLQKYDRQDRRIAEIVDPDGLALLTRWTVDGMGRGIGIARGTEGGDILEATQRELDGLNRVLVETAAPSSIFGPGAAHERDLRTRVRHDAAGRASRTIDALGHSSWLVHDAAGQLVQSIDAEGGVTSNVYSADGRLQLSRSYAQPLSDDQLAGLGDVAAPVQMVATAQDRCTRWVHDADGRQRFVLRALGDGTWAVQEERHDAQGRVIQTIAYDRGIRLTAENTPPLQDSEAFSLEQVAERLRAHGYDEARPETLALVHRQWFVYDACGQRRFTIDAQGGVTETDYDAAGWTVQEVQYAERIEPATYAEHDVIARLKPDARSDRRKQYIHDAAGRVAYELQATGRGKSLVTMRRHGPLGELRQLRALAVPLPDAAARSRTSIPAAVQALLHEEDRVTEFLTDAGGRVVLQRQRLSTQAWRVTRETRDALGRALRSVAHARLATDADAPSDDADQVTEQVYDAAGRLRFVIAPHRALTENEFDAAGRQIAQHRYGLTVSAATPRTLSALALRRSTRRVGDAQTRGERRVFDRTGRERACTDAAGHTEHYAHDALGQRVRFTDKCGAQWRYGYDALGRMVSQASPEVLVQGSEQPAAVVQVIWTRNTYDVFGNLRVRRQAADTADERTTNYSYDTLNRLTLQTEPGWYDPQSASVVADAGNDSTRFQRTMALRYDTFGQQIHRRRRIAAQAYSDEYKTHNALGQTVHAVDALHHVAARTYSAFGEPVTVTQHSLDVGPAPAASNGMWSLDALQSALSGDTQARTSTTRYDTLGRVVSVTRPAAANGFTSAPTPHVPAPAVDFYNSSPTIWYDYAGAFDEWQCERQAVDAAHTTQRFRYVDTAARETVSVDALGHYTLHRLDAWGQLSESVDYAQPCTGAALTLKAPAPPGALDTDRISRYGYDAMGQQVEVLRALQVSYEPDGAAYVRVERGRDQWLAALRTTYDAMGRVVATEDALGQRTHTSYNPLGQIVRVEEPGCLVAAAGAVDPFRDQVLATPANVLTLDRYGQVLRQERSAAGATALVTTQRYDSAGQATRRTDGTGATTRLRYDAAGLLIEEAIDANATLGDWQSTSQTLSTRHHHDLLGRRIASLQCFTLGQQRMQSGDRKKLNAFGEVLLQERAWGSADAPLDGLFAAPVAAMEYDGAGRLAVQHASNGITRFAYDLRGLVTREELRPSDQPDGTALVRISETTYDELGRPVLRHLPGFEALTQAMQDTVQAVTPYTLHAFDRWGNCVRVAEGGYVLHASGTDVRTDAAWTERVFDADNRVLSSCGPAAPATAANGITSTVRLQEQWHRDRLGRAVQEVCQAVDAATGAASGAPVLRARRWIDAAGRVTAEIDATSIRTEFAFDLQGHRVGVRDDLGTVRVSGYDAEGRLLTLGLLRRDVPGDDTLDPYSQPYDSRDTAQQPRPILLTQHLLDSAGRHVGTAEFAIDGVSADHPWGLPTAFWQYLLLDERGLVRATRDAAGTTMHYGFDVLGQRIAEEDGNANRREWLYTTLEGGASVGEVGRLRSTTVGGNRVTHYTYNGFGELAREHFSFQSGERRHEYHANGLPRRMTTDVTRGTPGQNNTQYMHSVQSIAYDHDVRGRRARERFLNDVTRNVAQYEYDPETRRTRLVGVTPERTVNGGVVWTRNDALGRLQEVKAMPLENDPRASIDHLRYGHDALGRRRWVDVSYMLPGQAPRQTKRWFDYDAQGRMTVADGVLEGTQIVPGQQGSALEYDSVGRRSATERWVCSVSGQTSPDLPGWVFQWQEHHEERYIYNDLGQLASVDQRAKQRFVVGRHNAGQPVPQGDSVGPWQPSSRRRLDWRGMQLRNDRYSRVKGLTMDNFTRATHVGQVVSTYRADARLRTQWSSVLDDGVHRDGAQTYLFYTYDAAGVLQNYTQHIGNYDRGPGDITHTYSYTYSTAFGGYRPVWLEVSSTAENAVTDDVGQVYNERGLLSMEYVNTPSSHRSRRFTYDGEDRIVTKVQDGAQSGRQDYFHSDGRFLASLGSLSGEHFVTGLNPLADGLAVPASYRVNAGDSLRSIAEAVFGDGQLWHLIADANSIGFAADDPLPAGEIGKSYRIPQNEGAVSNRAESFRAYNPGAIIDDFTPEILFRPKDDGHSWLASAVVTGVTVLVQRAGTVVLTPVMGPVGASVLASAAANAAGQGTALLLDQRDDFSVNEVVQAGMSGGLTGSLGQVPGTSLKRELLITGASHLGNQGLRAVANGRGFDADWRGLAASLASNTAAYQLKNWSITRDRLPEQGRTFVTQLLGSAIRGESLGLATFGRAVGSYLGERAGDRVGNWIVDEATAFWQAMEEVPAARKKPRGVMIASNDPSFLPLQEEPETQDEETIYVFSEAPRNDLVPDSSSSPDVPLTDLERSRIAVWLSGDPLAAQKSYLPGYIETRWREARQARDVIRRRSEFEWKLQRFGMEFQRRQRIESERAREYAREVARIRDENGLARSFGRSAKAVGGGIVRGAVNVVYEPVALGVDMTSLLGATVINAAVPDDWEVGMPHMFSSYGKRIDTLTDAKYDLNAELSAGEAQEQIVKLAAKTGVSSALGLVAPFKTASLVVGVGGFGYGVTMAAQAQTPDAMSGAFGELLGGAAGSSLLVRTAQRSLTPKPTTGGPGLHPDAPIGLPARQSSTRSPGPAADADVLRLPEHIRIADDIKQILTPEEIRAYVDQATDMYARTELDGAEWGGVIYRSPTKGVGWAITKGNAKSVDPHNPELIKSLPEDAVVIGYGHSHRRMRTNPQEAHSGDDFQVAIDEQVPVALITPNGRLKLFIPSQSPDITHGTIVNVAELRYTQAPGSRYADSWMPGLGEDWTRDYVSPPPSSY